MKTSLLISISLVASGFIFTAHSAGFDCSKAQNGVETMICNNAELSSLDETLAQKYQETLAANPDLKDDIREQQLQWLKFQRNTCKDEACLIQEYRERLDDEAVKGVAWGYPINLGAAELPPQQAFGHFEMMTEISSYDPTTKQWSDEAELNNELTIHRIPNKPYLAIIDAELWFTNLHSCTITDQLALWSKNHWVLNSENNDEMDELRLYPVTHQGKTELLLKDIDDQYRVHNCGARGYFDGIIMQSK